MLKNLILTLILTLQLSAADSLKLVHPNGGEVFEARTNTDILWQRIPDTSSVEIKFSSDYGNSWDVLFDSTDGLSEQWTVPDIESDSCLVLVNFTKIDSSINPSSIKWERSFGGREMDEANSIIQTIDCGYIVVGASTSSDGDVSNNKGSKDYWVVKLSANGELEWEKSYGGTLNDEARSVIQTTDGGFVVAGHSESKDGDITNPNGGFDYWVVKLTSKGELEWEKSYGGTIDEEAHSLIQTTDGGFVVAGQSDSDDGDISSHKGTTYREDYWIIKLNSIGELQWDKSYGGFDVDFGKSIKQTFDGGFIVTGYSYSKDGDITLPKGGADYWIAKLSPVGEFEWKRSYGGSLEDRAYSVVQTIDSGFVVVGHSESKNGNISNHKGLYDCWIIKLAPYGELQWEKSYGGSSFDQAYSVIQTNDNGLLISGHSRSSDGDIQNPKGGYDYWLLKLNSIGELEWEETYGSSLDEASFSAIQTNDGSIVVAGSREIDNNDFGIDNTYDIWVVKINGSIQAFQSDTSDAVFSIVKPDEPEPDTTYNFEYFVYDNNQSNSATAAVVLEEDTDITIEVFDVLGRRIIELYSGLATEGRNEYRIDYNDFQSGRYFVKLTTPKATKTEIIEILW